MPDPVLALLHELAATSNSKERAAKLRAFADLYARAADGKPLRPEQIAALAEGWANECDKVHVLEIVSAVRQIKRDPGRPKGVTLADLLSKAGIPQKKGSRPGSLTDEQKEQGLEAFIQLKAALERKRRCKLTDKEALGLFVADLSAKEHWSSAVQRKVVEKLAKIISRWRVKFGKRLRTKSR